MTPHIHLPPRDFEAALALALEKRARYPWNDWGRRLAYADLLAAGAALLDAWADPAFVHAGQPSLWLRAEVWQHPDGTAFRAALDAAGTVAIAPLECCVRPGDVGAREPCGPRPPSNDDDAWLELAYELRTDAGDD